MRTLFFFFMLSSALTGTLVYKTIRPANGESWEERVGLISFKPIKKYYPDYEDAAERTPNGLGAFLTPYLPRSARDIHTVESGFLDLVIAEYEFDESDLRFYAENWDEMKDQDDIDLLIAEAERCPWMTPIPESVSYYQSPIHNEMGSTARVIVDKVHFRAWYYYRTTAPMVKTHPCLQKK